jgi:flagellar protein FliJ
MKPFSLQTVLNYRNRLEDIAQHRLAEAKKVQHTIEKRLQEEQYSLTLFIEEAERLQKEGIGITELIRHEERITAQKMNIQAIAKNLTEKNDIVEKEQQNLVRRSMDRQILERLKDSQNSAWKGYLDKKEAAMLDEIAVSRHESEKF